MMIIYVIIFLAGNLAKALEVYGNNTHFTNDKIDDIAFRLNQIEETVAVEAFYDWEGLNDWVSRKAFSIKVKTVERI